MNGAGSNCEAGTIDIKVTCEWSYAFLNAFSMELRSIQHTGSAACRLPLDVCMYLGDAADFGSS